tara:strand:- start:2007 stop:2612 length:606 start_codon:yes stop_codon:yes gene_type:complete
MIPEGFMKNSQGHLVPESQVRDQDKLRDMTVIALTTEAIEISKRLEALKKKALADMQDVIQIAADRWEVDMAGKKGGITMTSYDGEYRIQRTYADRIRFTEEVKAAQELFAICLDRWTETADTKVQALVDRAFRTNRSGQMKTGELLGLMRLDINDPDWLKAVEALKESIDVMGSTVYIRFYKRIQDTDKYQLIPLDLAGV